MRVRHPSLAEGPFCASWRHVLRLVVEYGKYGLVYRNRPGMYEPLHERFRILKIGVFPCRAVQPKRTARMSRQSYVFSIAEIAWASRGMKVPIRSGWQTTRHTQGSRPSSLSFPVPAR